MTDEAEDMADSEMDTTSDMDGAPSDWPDSTRIDVIGQNGNEGIHYNYDRCVRYPDDD